MTRQRVLAGLLLVILGGLAWYSAHLAAVRIYQVDECQNLYMAKVLAAGQANEFFTNAAFFLLGPLSWLAKRSANSEDFFTSARLLFFGVFWLNLFLLGLIAGGRLSSTRGLLALTAAATLAPLWDYGFEIRHDNLILTGILLAWLVIRVKPMGLASYAIAGGIGIALLFVAVKAVVYVVPLAAAIVLFPPPSFARPRWQLALAWAGGALLATILIRLCYGTGGMWDLYLGVFRGVSRYSTGSHSASARFWPTWTLTRLLDQTPLLLAMTTAACLAAGLELWRRGKSALTWEGNLPELLLLAGAMVGLLANPTPYPYNLVNVVPYAFLLAFRYAGELGTFFRERLNLWPVAAAIIIFAHLVPFGIATLRHADHTNFRQASLMRLAEDLTDPNQDPVYDGVGMLPSRPSIHHQWFLHSLNLQSFVDGSGLKVREMLAARPAAVFIPNYRTDVLPEEDHAFIRNHYVLLADDFWVLGSVLPEGGGEFEIIHPGRYRISSLAGSDLEGTYPIGLKGLSKPEGEGTIAGQVDGKPFCAGPIELKAGLHRIESAGSGPVAVVWVGPKRERVHRLSAGDHRDLFHNWY